MPRKSLEANVEPKILIWARETVGLSQDEAAKRVNATPETLAKWENNEKMPTIVQLKKLAKLYKRPLAAFFLPFPPKEPSLPKDFRSLPDNKSKPFSLKTRLAIRRARRLQALALELSSITEHKLESNVLKITIGESPEEAANSARKWLSTSIKDQFAWKNESQAFLEWKRSIEDQGILVFQMSMPLEETRGFSLTDGKIPIIVLNETDVLNARIFSLFHELGHILLDKGGLCDMEESSSPSTEGATIETFCNHFAGAILVPKTELLNHNQVKVVGKPIAWNDDVLRPIGKEFKVSKEVILRRLMILGLAYPAFYKKKREEWQSQATDLLKKRKKFGRQNPPKKCLAENGAPMVSLVLDSYKKEKITYSDVADYLSIRLKHVPKVEHLIEGNV